MEAPQPAPLILCSAPPSWLKVLWPGLRRACVGALAGRCAVCSLSVLFTSFVGLGCTSGSVLVEWGHTLSCPVLRTEMTGTGDSDPQQDLGLQAALPQSSNGQSGFSWMGPWGPMEPP